MIRSGTYHTLGEEVKKYLFFNALFTFAVNLNDTQLITGCAVLAATFSQQCTMSVYHSEIVSWMMPVILAVGFLAPTSIIASIPLQEKWRGWEEIRFRGAEKHRIILTIVRAILTLVMTVFSFIYLGGVATSRSGWPHYALTRRNDPLAVTNAVCYMRNNGPSKTGLEHKHVIEMVILATYFFAWVIFFEMFFRRMILKSIRVNPTWNSDGWRFTLLTHGVLWMSCSLLFYSVVSLITIYDLRRKARDRFFAKDQLSPEDEWGFGQFIAIILIILPVKAFMDAWIGERAFLGPHRGMELSIADFFINLRLLREATRR